MVRNNWIINVKRCCIDREGNRMNNRFSTLRTILALTSLVLLLSSCGNNQQKVEDSPTPSVTAILATSTPSIAEKNATPSITENDPTPSPNMPAKDPNRKLESILMSSGNPSDIVAVEILFNVDPWEEADEVFKTEYPSLYRLWAEVRESSDRDPKPDRTAEITEAFELRAKLPSICFERRITSFLSRHSELSDKVIPDLFMQFAVYVSRDRLTELVADEDVSGIIQFEDPHSQSEPIIVAVTEGHRVYDGPKVEEFSNDDLCEAGEVNYRMFSIEQTLASADEEDLFRVIIKPLLPWSIYDKWLEDHFEFEEKTYSEWMNELAPEDEKLAEIFDAFIKWKNNPQTSEAVRIYMDELSGEAMSHLLGESLTVTAKHKSYISATVSKAQLSVLAPGAFAYEIYWADQEEYYAKRLGE